MEDIDEIVKLEINPNYKGGEYLKSCSVFENFAQYFACKLNY